MISEWGFIAEVPFEAEYRLDALGNLPPVRLFAVHRLTSAIPFALLVAQLAAARIVQVHIHSHAGAFRLVVAWVESREFFGVDLFAQASAGGIIAPNAQFFGHFPAAFAFFVSTSSAILMARTMNGDRSIPFFLASRFAAFHVTSSITTDFFVVMN